MTLRGLLVACMLVAASTAIHAVEPLDQDSIRPIGSTVDDLKFTDIRGLGRNLKELGQHQATVFVFTTTTCPLVRKYLPKLVELSAEFKSRGVQFVAVNVGADDTVKQMASQAIDFSLPFYSVKDFDCSCAKALGVKVTPEVVVLDAANTIRYRGRIDDQMRVGGAKPSASREDLRIALEEILEGKSVSVSSTPADGCRITEPVKPTLPSSDITWSSTIGSLIHAKCTGCHQAGTAAPFELRHYDEVVGNAEMIAEVVKLETMPPWYAARQHGHFQNDTSLSVDEKRTLLAWIDAGCPAGDLNASPTPPAPIQSEWRIGEPDLILTMTEEHTIEPTGFIPYKYVMLPHIFREETWVEAFEIKPLNTAVVHHCNMFHMSKDGAGVNTFITGYVPGGQPLDLGHYDNGVAYRLPAGASLGLQIHYTTIGTEQKAKIQVGLRFPRREIRKKLHHFVVDPRGWSITPGDPAFRIEGKYTLPHNANLLGLFTHMHVRGRDMTYFAVQEGQEPETLLQIPNFNFEWQLGYEIAVGQKVFPKGTQIRVVAHYDNSPFNPYNPDPSDTVEYGPQTIHEMFNGFAFYVDNDEQLSLRVNPENGQVIN
ncbi:MAG: redoxin family protein [Pirellulaceae bacterium]|nr:redoxin family protein [Pirellulaceae bacterium]